MGEVIYGVVFGKPKVEDLMADFYAECAKTGSPADPNKMEANSPGAFVTADGDILHIGGLVDLPSDTEPPNEPA